MKCSIQLFNLLTQWHLQFSMKWVHVSEYSRICLKDNDIIIVYDFIVDL